MLTSIRRFYWLVVIAAYWFCALWFLFRISPISVDGGGPSATFYWGNHPLSPTLAEYDGSTRLRLPFLYPCLCAASIITFFGCGLTTWLVRLGRPRRSHLFLVASAATLCLLLLVGGISDIGIACHIWRGPTMYRGISYLVAISKGAGSYVFACWYGIVALVGNPTSNVSQLTVRKGC